MMLNFVRVTKIIPISEAPFPPLAAVIKFCPLTTEVIIFIA